MTNAYNYCTSVTLDFLIYEKISSGVTKLRKNGSKIEISI